jgi:hypothetical protein
MLLGADAQTLPGAVAVPTNCSVMTVGACGTLFATVNEMLFRAPPNEHPASVAVML